MYTLTVNGMTIKFDIHQSGGYYVYHCLLKNIFCNNQIELQCMCRGIRNDARVFSKDEFNLFLLWLGQ